MQDQMLGVVLWANSKASTAVVWCEDQGNLAYYTGAQSSFHDGVTLDAGDLIQFEVREDSNMRRVDNPRRLDSSYAPGLADDLRRCGSLASTPPRAARDNVVTFPSWRCSPGA